MLDSLLAGRMESFPRAMSSCAPIILAGRFPSRFGWRLRRERSRTIHSRMRDDLTQEMEALAWEAQNRKLDVPQYSSTEKDIQLNRRGNPLSLFSASSAFSAVNGCFIAWSCTQAARFFKSGLRYFICHAGGWENGSRKNGNGKKRSYWQQMELSNTPSDSTEWDEEGEHFNTQVYRCPGIENDFGTFHK